MKKLFTLLCIGLLFTACAQQTKNETVMEFTDNVKEALADSGRIDLNSLQWTREPGGFEVKGDTILMLMNGIGIVGTLERLPEFFKQLDKILAPGGQVLCDSSDISYVFKTEDGIIELPDDMSYYGEHSFQMRYKDTIGEPFNWLYIDADTLREKAWRSGYTVEVIAEGEHYDYLARITKRE